MDNNAQMTEVEYQLQSSSDAQLSQAHIVYQGPDLARVVSGQSDGDYYYRIRALEKNQPITGWSETLKVTVAHHSLARALTFFIAGAIVFFSLLVFIINKHKSD